MTIADTIEASNRTSEFDATRQPQLVVSESIEADEFGRLLTSVSQEDCAHSWRNFPVDGTLDELVSWENERRPTKLFFFYRQHGETRRLAAAAAVADRLSADYPHPGLCVLGRCYIMPEFRNLGYYRYVLRYRLEYCREHFGDGLHAVHMGAVNERIERVITGPMQGWPRFVHIGEERLRVASEVQSVGAYLMFVPGFMDKMLDVLTGPNAPTSVIELRRTLSSIESERVRNLGSLVERTVEDPQAQQWFECRNRLALDEVLTFCRELPVVGFE